MSGHVWKGSLRERSHVTSSAWRLCGATSGDSSHAAFGLSYQAGRYKLQLETHASWTGSCRQLTLTLDDGTTHVANVNFN